MPGYLCGFETSELLKQKDLLLPDLDLKAENASGIDIVGVLFVSIQGMDEHGRTRESIQTCYDAKGGFVTVVGIQQRYIRFKSQINRC